MHIIEGIANQIGSWIQYHISGAPQASKVVRKQFVHMLQYTYIHQNMYIYMYVYCTFTYTIKTTKNTYTFT